MGCWPDGFRIILDVTSLLITRGVRMWAQKYDVLLREVSDSVLPLSGRRGVMLMARGGRDRRAALLLAMTGWGSAILEF
jgi:hypothetical protein